MASRYLVGWFVQQLIIRCILYAAAFNLRLSPSGSSCVLKKMYITGHVGLVSVSLVRSVYINRLILLPIPISRLTTALRAKYFPWHFTINVGIRNVELRWKISDCDNFFSSMSTIFYVTSCRGTSTCFKWKSFNCKLSYRCFGRTFKNWN